MCPGVTFERVYRSLKARVVSGDFRPGVQLEPSALSAELISSITPVRDALHRLVGERLVWTPRGDGFRMPIYTEAALRDLYGWSQRLLHLAVAGQTMSVMQENQPSEPADDPAAATAHLFTAIAQLSGSPEHVAAVAALNERLGAVRRQEVELIDPGPELAEMRAAVDAHQNERLRRLIATFHKQRIAKVPLLLTRLQPEF